MNIINIKNSLSFKLFTIGFLVAILMIPTGLIAVLVNERQDRQAEAVREISDKWALEQTLAGPILVVPYKALRETLENGAKKTEEVVQYGYFLPETVAIEGLVEPERRQRGIYEAVIYTAKLKISGEFNAPDFAPWGIKPEMVMGDKARIALGIPDVRGIKEEITFDWNGQKLKLGPGTGEGAVIPTGASAQVKLGQAGQNGRYAYSAQIVLNGSRNLSFSPLGRTSTVALSSGWPSPSFQGAFLPEERTVAATGFSARWKVLELNRSFPQSWLGDLPVLAGPPVMETVNYEKPRTAAMGSLSGYDFGVSLLVPADEYQKTTRTLKYSILVLALTFLILFFFEAFYRKQVHSLQYILIGLALSLFYVLVLSIAEYLGFNPAYLIAAAATIALITLYTKAVFRAWRPALTEALILVFIFGFIFVILQLEDYALLTGSVGLFAILAAVMYISRNIDWYGLNGSRPEDRKNILDN